MKTYNFKEFAKLIGVAPKTLRDWVKKGKVAQPYRAPSGRPFFVDMHLQEYLNRAAKNDWDFEK